MIGSDGVEAGSQCTSAINCKSPSGRGRATRLSSSSRGCTSKLQHIIFVGALYHSYQSAALLDYIETGVDAVTAACPSATVVLAGDINMLDDAEVATRGALQSVVDRPTRGANTLDRIYVSYPCYATIRVVNSTVESDHKAVVALPVLAHPQPLNKRRHRRLFGCRSPAQHARFLEYASTLNFEFDENDDVQANFDIMCGVTVDLLNLLNPEHAVTVTSFDPPYITPAVNALLRRKNRLMHAGRTEEAGAVAARICSAITRSSMKKMRKVDTRNCTKDAWVKMCEVVKGPANHADRSHGANISRPLCGYLHR